MRRWALAALALFIAACSKSSSPAALAHGDAGAETARVDLASIARAEDQRRAADVGERALTSHDVVVRRRAAEALARIADDTSEAGLVRALSDEDAEVAAWGAYGLGFSCKGKEDIHVQALAARAASLDEPSKPPQIDPHLDPKTAIARAVGRCGGVAAEKLLVSWVVARSAWSEPATYGLGDLGNKRGTLADETTTALLDAASPSASGAPVATALYPFSRTPKVLEAFAPRVLEALRGRLDEPGADRIFIVRALGRIGAPAAVDLARIASTGSFTNAERGEAARALGTIGLPGRQGAADALGRIVAANEGTLSGAKLASLFSIIDTLVRDLGGDAPGGSIKALQTLAAIPADPSPVVLALRCDAASALVNKAYDAPDLLRCGPEGASLRERAILRTLLRRPLVNERRKAWLAFARSSDVRVREDALEAIADHPELGDATRTALALALTSKKAGVVTTAGDMIKRFPDRALVVSAKARSAALDPSSPPPVVGSAPAREVDPEIARAIAAALAEPWAEDLVETRIALLNAAVAIDSKGAREAAAADCRDANVTLRDAGKKALAALGEPYAACNAPDPATPAALEIDHPIGPTKLTFASDVGPLVVHLDPTFAPIAAARMKALAEAGFFKGILIHRVVPGFVVQFGDPQGDGFGGSGKLLRCETSPLPFLAGDVGIALAGRDTGSSQMFVTLSRTPHLDGEYTHLGRADGPWDTLVEGDALGDVKVEDDDASK